MKNRTVVMRGGYCRWQPKTKRKIQPIEINSGSITLNLVVGVFVVLAGVYYLYSVNKNAVKGYQMRSIENEIGELRKDNDSFKIKEAELKSLYRIEEASKNFNMIEAKEVSYIRESGPVALK